MWTGKSFFPIYPESIMSTSEMISAKTFWSTRYEAAKVKSEKLNHLKIEFWLYLKWDYSSSFLIYRIFFPIFDFLKNPGWKSLKGSQAKISGLTQWHTFRPSYWWFQGSTTSSGMRKVIRNGKLYFFLVSAINKTEFCVLIWTQIESLHRDGPAR